jgi:hypothetical protein
MGLRLPDFRTHWPFNELRRSMGAELVEYRFAPTSSRITRKDLERLATTGIQIDAEQVETLADGTFSYEGERVLLYIMQPYATYAPKFHLANCFTWEQQKAKRRQERYVASMRTDGLFVVERENDRGQRMRGEERLQVCQNCLQHVSWRKFDRDTLPRAERRRRVETFSLAEYFAEKKRSDVRERPRYTVETMPSGGYTDDFDQISSTARRAAGWKCSTCRRTFALGYQRRFLHVHHENCVKGDNRPENLKVICIGCHANEPDHAHLRHSPGYKMFAQLYAAH